MANVSAILTLTMNISQSLGINRTGFCSPKMVSERVCSKTSPEAQIHRFISKGCKLVGCGSALPNLQFSNDDLSKIVNTDDDWISSRTGIRNRYILTGNESMTSMAVKAAQKALQMAKIEPDDVDLILFCSSTPEDLFGGASEVQKTLGCKSNPPAFDIRAACSGFVLGLVTAASHIRGGGFKNVLVIGTDSISRYVDWTDRKTCVLFGDAAGAILVQACDCEEDGLYGFDLNTDGDARRYLYASVKQTKTDFTPNANGSALGIYPTRSSISHILMNGQEIFRLVVKVVPESIEASLAKANLRVSDIDWLLLHQANQRIIDRVATKLEFPKERVISNVANYGNTSAASIPLALDEAIRNGRVKAGQTILTAGFGAGFTWGSAILRWG